MVNVQGDSHQAAGFDFPIFCNYCTFRPPNVPRRNRRGLTIKVRGEIKLIPNITISDLKLKVKESERIEMQKTLNYDNVNVKKVGPRIGGGTASYCGILPDGREPRSGLRGG